MWTSLSCCHISDFSVSFVLHVGRWDRREARKHHEREPGGVGGALEGGGGGGGGEDSTV